MIAFRKVLPCQQITSCFLSNFLILFCLCNNFIRRTFVLWRSDYCMESSCIIIKYMYVHTNIVYAFRNCTPDNIWLHVLIEVSDFICQIFNKSAIFGQWNYPHRKLYFTTEAKSAMLILCHGMYFYNMQD